MTKQEKDRLKQLVANNKIDMATKKLLQYRLDEDDRNEVIALQARYNQLQQAIRLETLSIKDQNLQRSRITNSLLSLIDNVDEEDNDSNIMKNKRRGCVVSITLSFAAILSLGTINFLTNGSLFDDLLKTLFSSKPEQLTVFVTDINGNAALEYVGELNIPIGNRILNSPIERDGRTNFGDITSDNIGDQITIGLKAEGWEIDGTNKFLFEGKPIKLTVKRDNSLGKIRGIVMTRDGQNFIDSARITINARTTIYSDTNGFFEIILPKEMRVESDIERYRLTVSKEGYQTATEYFQVRSSDAEIRLTKND